MALLNRISLSSECYVLLLTLMNAPIDGILRIARILGDTLPGAKKRLNYEYIFVVQCFINCILICFVFIYGIIYIYSL